jgi:hypothetical protein
MRWGEFSKRDVLMKLLQGREVNKMLRLLAIVMITGSTLTTGYAQSSRKPEPGFVVHKESCGLVYWLENTPVYFGHPKTTSQIWDVIRILRSAPAQADVQCHDYNDAWAPYLFADRKVRIAGLLIKLKRYDEAREELWGLFLQEGVLYRGQKLHYDMGTGRAISLLMSDELWSVKDMDRRLKDPRYFVEQIKAAHDRRRRLASSK